MQISWNKRNILAADTVEHRFNEPPYNGTETRCNEIVIMYNEHNPETQTSNIARYND